MDLGGLAVRISCSDALAECLEVEQVQRHWFKRTCEGIFASRRLLVWYSVQCFQNARPECFVARSVSFRAFTAGQSSFQGRPFFRIGMIGMACRSMMAEWQRRVS